MNRIEKFYDKNPHKEKTRLTRSAYDTIESEITRRFLFKHLKPSSKIAEVGCGAGHYSTWLLKNHNVHLVDLSSELLKLAEDEIKRADLFQNVLGISKLDARELTDLSDNSFDATLVMGPLYHLIDEKDRIKCLSEAYRITKKGGLIFSATINRVCPFLNMMHMHTEQLAIELSEDTEEMQRIMTSGKYENFEENPNNFTDAYFSNVHEVPKHYKKLGIELVESFACEVLAAYLYDKAEIIKKNEKAWNRFLNIIFENANKPELIGTSEHVVFIGRKV
jgi:ubiquinone/menaquinone biosynthesis C-methylase UbiE